METLTTSYNARPPACSHVPLNPIALLFLLSFGFLLLPSLAVQLTVPLPDNDRGKVESGQLPACIALIWTSLLALEEIPAGERKRPKAPCLISNEAHDLWRQLDMDSFFHTTHAGNPSR